MESLTPNIFVKDINENIKFYHLLGFELVVTVPETGNDLIWAMMAKGNVTMMFQTMASLGQELLISAGRTGLRCCFTSSLKTSGHFLNR